MTILRVFEQAMADKRATPPHPQTPPPPTPPRKTVSPKPRPTLYRAATALQKISVKDPGPPLSMSSQRAASALSPSSPNQPLGSSGSSVSERACFNVEKFASQVVLPANL